MLLYLFALEYSGDDLLGDHAVAAGVQYFPARAPYLPADGAISEEEAAALREKAWKRRGLLLHDDAVLEAMGNERIADRLPYSIKKDGTVTGDLADRQQLKQLQEYLFHLLGEMVDEIASGVVDPNPYTRGSSHDACAFCPYSAICHKETVLERRNYKAMPSQRFWDEITKEMKDHG